MKRPLGDELLFGRLEHGGDVTIDAGDKKLAFSFEPKKKSAELVN